MNILMLTNTFTPHVGGVARSVESFTAAFRKMGHRVLVVAPQFEGMPTDEEDVVRIPAIQNFNGSDFSVRLPIPGLLNAKLAEFKPDVIHAHHPFLLGDTAVRIAAAWDRPLVFTHHTMHERYTHYVPGDSPAMARFVVRLATGYANLCDRVFAPSQSVAAILRQRGVLTPIDVVPTGIDTEAFHIGEGRGFRQVSGIPQDAFVIGHVGRLAPEKNLDFLARAVAQVVRRYDHVHFLVVGSGSSESDIRAEFRRLKIEERLHLAGVMARQELINAYHAMDVFAFASFTETQGMVLTEAMAAGVPVVAVDAPGVREVVVDGQNGRLLRRESHRGFVRALADVVTASPQKRDALRRASEQTAEQFSVPRCVSRALEIYQSLLSLKPRDKQAEDSVWEAAIRWLGSEWALWSNLASSATRALRPRRRWRVPGVRWLARTFRQFRRWANRSEWGIRLLGLSTCEYSASQPGLILVQIDGLSRTQFERALARRRMPFLRWLMFREGYQLETLYSGLPSSTPAVQGELFYGVKTAVPAFAYRDRNTEHVVRMLEPEPAIRVEERLKASGRGLLEGGSAYSNIYVGGAEETHFCSPNLGWGRLLQNVRRFSLLTFILWNFMSLLRVAGLTALEFLLAIVDFIRGRVQGRNFKAELKSIPSRVGVSIVLRELVTIGACLDAARGLPVIHINFLGYDEQSHRRGPGSAFAHWSLKGIDGCIRRICQAARRSRRRDYQVWIYSDHGQEHTIPYMRKTGRTIQDAVAEAFQQPVADQETSKRMTQTGTATQRSLLLGGGRLQKLFAKPDGTMPAANEKDLVVAALGPIALVYAPDELTDQRKTTIAEHLVREGEVPAVYMTDHENIVWAVTRRGRFRMPEEAAEVLGPDHPFPEETAQDLIALCQHPDAGDLQLSGWVWWSEPVSFPLENGAHAGPGCEETRGLLLLPPGACLPETVRDYYRPSDLRAAALDALGRKMLPVARRIARPRAEPGAIRVMTYNVHSCVGTDGRLSPARIARLIAQYEPDIVALQELDVGRMRTEEIDQAHRIARELEMEFHFQPSVQIEGERFGNAVLSPHPMRLIRAGQLPGLTARPEFEPRSALWVEVNFGDFNIQVLNTHLGLNRHERMAQVEELLGPAWIGGPERRDPFLLCGDINAFPQSRVYRRLARRFRDAQVGVLRHRPRQTFWSRYPLARIDHVFLSDDVDVIQVEVPRTGLAAKASDHLPLIVDVRLVRGAVVSAAPAARDASVTSVDHISVT